MRSVSRAFDLKMVLKIVVSDVRRQSSLLRYVTLEKVKENRKRGAL